MKGKTLKELRAYAKARGLKGYSKWTKDELVRRLEEPRAAHTTEAIEPLRAGARAKKPAAPAASTTAGLATASRPAPAKSTPPPAPAARAAVETALAPERLRTVRTAPAFPAASQRARPEASTARPVPASSSAESRSDAEEEQVEGAKYALRPNGMPAPHPPVDLGEDIDRLPALLEPALCLLSQKPGVLYAYWLLPPGATERSDYKLRLCRSIAEAFEVYAEIPVPFGLGGWYFQVPENVRGHEVLVQLGYYQDGKFVAAQGQSTAHLPSLYASTRTDHRWWISDEDFARMYLAGGGVIAGAPRYGGSGSTSSPAAAPGAPSSAQSPPEKRMAWPGGVSSR